MCRAHGEAMRAHILIVIWVALTALTFASLVPTMCAYTFAASASA